jgi:hypothetical protein
VVHTNGTQQHALGFLRFFRVAEANALREVQRQSYELFVEQENIVPIRHHLIKPLDDLPCILAGRMLSNRKLSITQPKKGAPVNRPENDLASHVQVPPGGQKRVKHDPVAVVLPLRENSTLAEIGLEQSIRPRPKTAKIKFITKLNTDNSKLPASLTALVLAECSTHQKSLQSK